MTALIVIGVIAAVFAAYWVCDLIFDNTVGRGIDAVADRFQKRDISSDLDRFKSGGDRPS